MLVGRVVLTPQSGDGLGVASRRPASFEKARKSPSVVNKGTSASRRACAARASPNAALRPARLTVALK